MFSRVANWLLVFWFITPAVGLPQAEKVAVLWCDPLLNLRDISTREGVINILTNAQNTGFGAIALGVKALNGEVIYDSKIAPRLQEWEGFRALIDFDPVKAFVEEGRRRQLQIYAVFDIFSEGHMIQRRGPVYTEHPDWQTMVYVVEDQQPKVKPITDWAYGTAAFVNPLLSQVQDYEIAVVKEFLKNYTVDGIIFDKVRFSGIEADFSEASRKLFESKLGSDAIQWWPQDVLDWQFINEEWEVVPGKYYKEWIEFRAQAIHDFMNRLVREVQEMDSTLPIGNFVGAWYHTYYEYGVNWASATFSQQQDWASPEYTKTAIAELLNFLVVGCYFPRVNTEEAETIGASWWMSVEGSAITANEVVNDACPVYAAILVELFKQDSEKFKKSLTTALNNSRGLYVYDFSQIERFKFWDEIGEVLKLTQ
jgi:uncharacterized lipoprotein YddW (UPF0748 family)